MGRLKCLPPSMKILDVSIAKVPDKIADDIYGTPEYRQWRTAVMKRAGWRCQYPGCDRKYPGHRIHADHIVALKDGGSPFDVKNGQGLCDIHHTKKSHSERTRRFQSNASVRRA